jgi:hypothetical protein
MIKFFALKLIRIISLIPSRIKIKFLNNLLNKFNEKDSTYYYTINYRKKFFKESKNKNKSNLSSSIIIQGPILRKNNFTFNTINLYIKNCKSTIILSTWKNDLSENEIRRLKKKDVKIILNEPPDIAGPVNVNFQLKTTSAALKLSAKIGNKFCIKTRTDCRLYLENFDENLIKLYAFFKKNNNSLKLGSTSLTMEKRLFGISDILMFGPTKLLLNYFPDVYSKKEFENFSKFLKNIKNKDNKFLKDSYKCIPENFLCYNFIKRTVNKKVRYSSENYYKSLKNNFFIIDNAILDFFWYKYNHQYEYRDKSFADNNLYTHFTYLKWLRFFS